MTKATKHAHTGGTEEAGREHKSAEGRHTQLDRGLRSRGWVLGWGEGLSGACRFSLFWASTGAGHLIYYCCHTWFPEG